MRWATYFAVLASVLSVGLALGVSMPLVSLRLETWGYGSFAIGVMAAMPAVGVLIGASLASAMADVRSREASLITFLAAAANITLFGIGGAFWGLLIGLVAYAVLNGRLPRREPVFNPAAEPVTRKGAAN